MIQSILNKSTLYWAIGARRLALASPPGDTTSERLSAWRCRPKKCRRRSPTSATRAAPAKQNRLWRRAATRGSTRCAPASPSSSSFITRPSPTGGRVRGSTSRSSRAARPPPPPSPFFCAVLGPLTVALAQTAHGHPFFGTLGWLARHGVIIPGPMWFVEALLIFSAAYVALRAGIGPALLEKVRPFPSNRALAVAALAT